MFNSLFIRQTLRRRLAKTFQMKKSKFETDKMKQALEDGTYAEDGFSREEYEKAIQEQEEAYHGAPIEQYERTGRFQRHDAASPIKATARFLRSTQNQNRATSSASARTRATLPNCRARAIYTRRRAGRYGMANAVLYREGEALRSRRRETDRFLSGGTSACRRPSPRSGGAGRNAPRGIRGGRRAVGETDGIVQSAEYSAFTFLYERVVSGVPVAADVWEDNTAESRPWNFLSRFKLP